MKPEKNPKVLLEFGRLCCQLFNVPRIQWIEPNDFGLSCFTSMDGLIGFLAGYIWAKDDEATKLDSTMRRLWEHGAESLNTVGKWLIRGEDGDLESAARYQFLKEALGWKE